VEETHERISADCGSESNLLMGALQRRNEQKQLAKQLLWNDLQVREYPLTYEELERQRAENHAVAGRTPLLRVTGKAYDVARSIWNELTPRSKLIIEAGVLVPIGAVSFARGLSFPDLDISLLGIGAHRFCLFHSALAVFVLQQFFEDYQLFVDEESTLPLDKLMAAGAAGFGYGIALHLGVDALLQPDQDIVFGVPGVWQRSIVERTLVDDNIWLFGNALYALALSNRIVALAYGDELNAVKEYIYESFGPLRKD
jgi:hypothetical protein